MKGRKASGRVKKKKKQNVQQRQGKRGKGKAGYIENTIKEEIQI